MVNNHNTNLTNHPLTLKQAHQLFLPWKTITTNFGFLCLLLTSYLFTYLLFKLYMKYMTKDS